MEQMLSVLEMAKGKCAVAGIKMSPEPDVGAYHLTVEVQGGRYLLALQEYSTDGDNVVRMFLKKSSGHCLVEFFGDMYDERSVLEDFDVVRDVFVQFLGNGDVSREVLS
ncbi:hypothetical protein GO998_13000 [Ralstonia syzygii]|uniref:Uncharacterized protein n=1 Tax=Ralstonia syzygii TaxID=28097 RepID=A0ABX7ZHX4_9RALS|nr:hypothetical protein [Ralstonia syzygii]QUP54588.1 hypothetical protein GO998_13000 [Ralstonia syzygii]